MCQLHGSTQMVCMDELSKDDQMISHHYGRASTGQCAVIDAQWFCGERHSILPAMTVDGYITMHIISGSVQGEEFFDSIVEDVICHDALSYPWQLFIAPLASTDEPLPQQLQHPHLG